MKRLTLPVGCLVLALLSVVSRAAPDASIIRLSYGEIDTASAPEQAGFRSLRATGSRPVVQQQLTTRGTAPWLVQFRGPIRDAWKAELAATGAAIKDYVPDDALLIEATPKQVQAILRLPDVIWTGEYLPAYKQSSPVRTVRSMGIAETAEYEIVLFRPEDVATVEQALVAMNGVEVISAASAGDRGLIRARLPASVVETIATRGEVEWITTYEEPAFFSEVAVTTNFMNVMPVWNDLGLSGAGQVIAVCDTGLDTGDLDTLHPDFAGRVRWTQAVGRPNLWNDPTGHGTHVIGSVLGSGAASTGLYRGVAYDAELVLQSALGIYGGVSTPADLGELFKAAFTNDAKIHSNSWGAKKDGEYTLDARNLDKFVWQHNDMLILIAAGNHGVDANTDGVVDGNAISSPATAKNGLAVGAAESLRPTNITWGARSPFSFSAEPIFSDVIAGPAESPQGMAAFSSRGPCDDGRIKPDIVAPGTYILSTRSRAATGSVVTASGNTNYWYASGTSMATPLTAGAAGLARAWLQDHAGLAHPSAAMLKALLINGARNMAPGQYGTGAAQEIAGVRPGPVQGWGHVDLANSLMPGDGSALEFHDTFSLATGQTNHFNLNIANPPGGNVVITMAYSDYWAALGAGPKLVNDLDLLVRKPSGGVVYPNGRSSPDNINNVEMIEFAPDEAGLYRVEVAGRNVPMGGAQPYALVIHRQETGSADDFAVAPYGPFAAAGPEGGPSAPATMNYVLTNHSDGAVSWQLQKSAGMNWLDISVTSGVMTAQDSATVELSINTSAASLAPGDYQGLLTWINGNTGDQQHRGVALTVRPQTGFAWDAISLPQQTGAVIAVSVAAVDAGGAPVTTYNGTALMEGVRPVVAASGESSLTLTYPLSTYFSRSRAQVIYTVDELGTAARIDGLALDLQTLPSMLLSRFTVRIKHTALEAHPAESWESPSSGWTTVFQDDFTVPNTGWVHIAFSQPFDYDGVNSLMVDFSHWDSTYAGKLSDGRVNGSAGMPGKVLYHQTLIDWGDPLQWEGANNPVSSLGDRFPNIRFAMRQPVAAVPEQPVTFTNGRWSGTLTFDTPQEGILLGMRDDAVHGDSNLFDVDGEAPAAPASLRASATNFTGFTAAWDAVAGATSYRLDVARDDGFSEFITGASNVVLHETNRRIEGLNQGTTYYFRVKAQAGSLASDYTEAASVTIPVYIPPQDESTNRFLYDGFSSSNYTVGALLSQNPSVPGFSNAWNAGSNISAGGTNYALTYPGLETDDSGGAYSTTTGNRALRDLSSALSGTNVYYLSILMENDAIHANTNNYRALELWNFGNRNLQIGANRDVDGVGTAWGMRVIDNNSFRTSSVPAVAGQTVLAVARITFSTTSGGDAVRLWINPADLASESNSTNYIELTGFDFNGNTINRLSLAAYSGSAAAAGHWDEIRMGTTWASVLPAPQAPTFGVTYEANGATSGEPPVDVMRYGEGDTVSALGNTGALERDGYSFEDWNTEPDGSGTRFASGDTFVMGDADVVLYANWERLPQPPGTYTVTYYGNGSTGGVPPEDFTYYEPGDTVFVAGTGTMIRAGWAFDGWNTQEDGEGTMFQPDDTFAIGPAGVDLHAAWQLNPSTGKHVRVFVLAGQSNMRGSGTIRQAPGAWRPLEGVLFDETTPSEPASFSSEWELIGATNSVDHMGPEMSFAAALREAYTNQTIAIVKVSQSGTGIKYWRDPGEAGHDTLLARISVVTNRLNALIDANDIPSWSFGGFLWMQGENEANSTESVALAYSNDFAAVAANIRQHTGVTNLPVVVGRISIQLDPAAGGPVKQPQLDYVRAGQVTWADNDIAGAWVDTDDLTLIDNWHFGSVGQLGLGQRFAAAWFSVAESRPSLALRRASGQTTRTRGSSIAYDALFSTPVTGFDAGDVMVSGNTGAAQVNVQPIAPFDDSAYRVTISGMHDPGVVNLHVPAAAAHAGELASLPGIAEETAVIYTPHPGVADLLAYDPMDAQIRPLNRFASGAGWTGTGWEIQNNLTNGYRTSVDSSLIYGNLLASPAYATGGDNSSSSARALDLEKTFAEFMTSRGAGAVDVPGTTLWLSYVIRADNAGQRQRVALLRGTGATYSDASNMLRIEQAGGLWQMIAMNNAVSNNTGISVLAGTNYLMVLRLHIGGAASVSSAHVWINPDPATLGGNAPDLATATSSITVTNADFKFGRINWYPGGSANNGSIDEIRIGTTFASVTPVPVEEEGELDSDADGLPDWWEELYFDGVTNANAGALAANGLNTLLECYVAGIDPTVASAHFEISALTGHQNGFVIQWSPVSGRVYQVLWSTNLMQEPAFSPFAQAIPWTQSAYTDVLYQAEPAMYYQLKVGLESP